MARKPKKKVRSPNLPKSKQTLGGISPSQPSAVQHLGIGDSLGADSATTELSNSKTAEFIGNVNDATSGSEEVKKPITSEPILNKVDDEQPKLPSWFENFVNEHWKKIATVIASGVVAIIGTVFVIGRWTGTIESNIVEIKQGIVSNKEEISSVSKELRSVANLVENQKNDIQKVVSEIKDTEGSYEKIRESFSGIERKQAKTEAEIEYVRRDLERVQVHK